VQVGWTSLLPPRCCPSPGSSSGSCRSPSARPVPERTDRCEPPRLRSTSEPYPSPWPIQRPSPGPSTPSDTGVSAGVPLAPPSTYRCSVHSRSRPESRSLRPRSSTFEVSFRPRGFAPPRRFLPLLRLRACCIPLPILGFIRVSGPCRRRSSRSTSGRPRDAGPAPRRSPRRQPFRVTAVVTSLSFAPDHRLDARRAVASVAWIGVGGS